MNSLPTRIFYCVIFCSFLLNGCAFFPETDPISEVENQAVRDRFKEMIASQKDCHCCLDGAVHVQFKNFFYKGAISGYLQAMSPSHLKFMALSPLGQPVLVLTSDGETFQYIDVAEQTAYSGSVEGKTFLKYAPEGFSPEFTFYWLSGKLCPGDVSLVLTSREQNGTRYWLELHYEDGRKSMILFDLATQHIYHHIVYNSADDVILEIVYDEYGNQPCAVPKSIVVTSLTLNTAVHIKLCDLVDKVALAQSDFSYPVPPTFKKEAVE